ncbi:MAG: hypothetical protein JWL95_638 [Gemmatimonadetes bacterium]|nr:hypothetical protein [Gemmatimonadota bacterium]
MTTPVSIPDLERPAFFDGQRLEADDLAAMYDFHRELRWLHNRALHNWGIAVGFGVSGVKGGREVTVSPGYALDCNGHDLLLSRPITLPVPAVSGTASGKPMLYYLTASYVADADLAPSESRDGECSGGGAVRRVEAPLVRWQDPRSIVTENRWRRGTDIVLAAVQVLDCALVAAPSLAERRSARPETQPFVAAGRSVPATTIWTFFSSGAVIAGIQTFVDTSSAGFQRTPAYTAQVVGTRVLKADTGAGNGQLVDGFGSVVSPTASGFVYRLLMPRNLKTGPYLLNPDAIFAKKTLDTLRTALEWSVSWMGIEG